MESTKGLDFTNFSVANYGQKWLDLVQYKNVVKTHQPNFDST